MEKEKQLLELIEELTTNVHAVQERVLAEILGHNADSEYLAVRCGLAGATNRSTFRAKVPMVTYDDLKPYVMRVVNGDGSPILTGSAHPVTEFFLSSVTSGGEPKLIPVVKDNHDRDSLMESLAMAVMSRQTSVRAGQRAECSLLLFRQADNHDTGLPVHSATTSVFKHKVSKELASYDPSHSRDTSPPGAILCEDVFQSTYAQMLCGLCHRHAVLRIGTLFASGVVRAITFLQLHWRQLAADIEDGTLSQCITDESVRDAVAAAAVLRAPDPELAQFIRTECAKGDWAGIIMRIWPNTKFIYTIVTGSMAQYVRPLNYYSAAAPIASPKYVSSECCFGINLRPMCDPSEVSYTILPNMAYFEFLPVDAAATVEDATARDLVDLAGVETGREYEVVVTTYNGLNHYRVGDVLRVTGFHNAAPQFRFVGRKNVLLSLDADKTGEAELQHAVERAASTVLKPLGAAVLDYTSRACTESIPGHYVIYWELQWFAAAVDGGAQTTATPHQSMSMDGDVLARCSLEMEEALTYVYREHRVVDGSMGPLEIRVVRSGTFQELAEHAVSHGAASMAQYKVPRCVTNNPAIIRLLDSRVVSSHFSPSLPHWTPDRPKR